MDGAKSTTDTADILRNCDRQAPCEDGSFPEREDGPRSDENPGGSRTRAE